MLTENRRGRPYGCVFKKSLQQRARHVISPDGMTPTELSVALGTSHGYARLILNRMVDKGQARWSGPRKCGNSYFIERKAFVVNSFSYCV